MCFEVLWSLSTEDHLALGLQGHVLHHWNSLVLPPCLRKPSWPTLLRMTFNPPVPPSPWATKACSFSASWPRPRDLDVPLLYLILRHSNPMAFLNSHLLCPQPTTLSLLVVIYSWSHPCSCGPQASPGSVHSREWHGHLYLLCLFHQSLGRQELWELGARHCHCWTEWSSAPEGNGVRWVGGSLSVYKEGQSWIDMDSIYYL